MQITTKQLELSGNKLIKFSVNRRDVLEKHLLPLFSTADQVDEFDKICDYLEEECVNGAKLLANKTAPEIGEIVADDRCVALNTLRERMMQMYGAQIVEYLKDGME
eukprot:893166_1